MSNIKDDPLSNLPLTEMRPSARRAYIMKNHKKCKRCGLTKTIGAFYNDSDFVPAYCRVCVKKMEVFDIVSSLLTSDLLDEI